jgi:hypothetical protein
MKAIVKLSCTAALAAAGFAAFAAPAGLPTTTSRRRGVQTTRCLCRPMTRRETMESVFAVRGDDLTLRQVIRSGGTFPVSVAVHGDRVYVLNAEDGGAGFGVGQRWRSIRVRSARWVATAPKARNVSTRCAVFCASGHEDSLTATVRLARSTYTI